MAKLPIMITLIVKFTALITAYEIDYNNCLNPTSIKTYMSAELCPLNQLEPEIPEDKSYTILQQPITRKVRGYNCRVRRSTYHFKCGAWGHLKLAAVPQILHPIEISLDQCNNMVNTRTYHLPGDSKPFSLELNKEEYLQLTDKGQIKEENNHISCTGETVHIGSTLHTNVVVLHEYSFMIRNEEFLVSADTMEAITDHVRLPCQYETRGCLTGEGTYTWTRYNQPCNLEIVQSIRPSKVRQTYLVDHDSQFLINTTGITNLPSCPMALIKTNHPTIFLAQTDEVISLPTVEAREIDISLQSLIHTNYVAYQLEREFDKQDHTIQQRVCSETRLNQKTEPTPLGDGQFGLRKGDVFLIFQCQKTKAKLREDTSCWSDIPIEGGFVTPTSKQFILHSNKIPCSQTFPMIVKTLQGWVEILPHLKIRPAPLEHLPQEIQPTIHEDYSRGGLYSTQELAEWKHELSFPTFHQALLKSLSYGSCLQDGRCPTAENSDIQPYDIDHLIPNLERGIDLWSRFRAFLKENGDNMAFACLFILSIKFLSDLVLISVTVMRAGPAAAAALIASLYLYNQRTYQRILQRHQQRHQNINRQPADKEEQVPLQISP